MKRLDICAYIYIYTNLREPDPRAHGHRAYEAACANIHISLCLYIYSYVYNNRLYIYTYICARNSLVPPKKHMTTIALLCWLGLQEMLAAHGRICCTDATSLIRKPLPISQA